MNPLFNAVAAMVIATSLFLSGLFMGHVQPQIPPTAPPKAGGTFTPAQIPQTTLSGAGITSSASTIQLVSFATRDGRAVTMTMLGTTGYGTLEPGSSKEEIISFTGITQNANGTAILTGVNRGLDFISPYAASTTLSKAHAGGSIFIMSNTAPFYGQQFLFSNNNGTSTAILVFGSTTPPRYDSVGLQASGTYNATTSEFASILYVNNVVAAGCATGTEGVTGCLRLGTQLQMASSTFAAGTPTVVYTKYSTSTPYTPDIWSVVTQKNGTIFPGFIATSSANTYTWGASTTYSGVLNLVGSTTILANSTTLNGLTLNGITYKFPSVQPSITSQSASGTVMMTNGAGVLSFGRTDFTSIASTTITSAVASTTLIGIATSSDLHIIIDAPAVANEGKMCIQFNGDTAGNYQYSNTSDLNVNVGPAGVTCILLTNSANNENAATYAVIDITNRISFQKNILARATRMGSGVDSAFFNVSGGWFNTTAAIGTITIGIGGAGQIPVGTRITVFAGNQ